MKASSSLLLTSKMEIYTYFIDPGYSSLALALGILADVLKGIADVLTCIFSGSTEVFVSGSVIGSTALTSAYPDCPNSWTRAASVSSGDLGVSAGCSWAPVGLSGMHFWVPVDPAHFPARGSSAPPVGLLHVWKTVPDCLGGCSVDALLFFVAEIYQGFVFLS